MKKYYESAAAPSTSNNRHAFYARARSHELSSQQATQFVYKERSYLGECFCGPKLWVCDQTPMYVQLIDTCDKEGAALQSPSSTLNKSKLPKRSVVFRVDKNEQEGGRVKFALTPGNYFEYVPQNYEQEMFELLDGIGRDTTPTRLNGDLQVRALSIMKQSKHVFFQYEYGYHNVSISSLHEHVGLLVWYMMEM